MEGENIDMKLPAAEHHESIANHTSVLISIFYHTLISKGITNEEHIIRMTEAWIYATFGGDCEP